MAGNVNKVFLMGNLTRDVELRALPTGTSVGNFGLAVNERYKDKSDQWVERANFFDCSIFGKRAEALAKYLSKGSPVFLEGKLRFEQWQDKEGNNRSKVTVAVDNFEFVGGDSGGGNGQQAQPQAAPAAMPPADDIPF